jgi:predicted ribosomally synthesized peptide with nif11-like leader
MSVAAAKALIERMSTDVDFRAKVAAAPTPEAKRAILDEAGYGGVDEADVRGAAPELKELSDAELEAVAGGRTVEWVSATATVTGAVTIVAVAVA